MHVAEEGWPTLTDYGPLSTAWSNSFSWAIIVIRDVILGSADKSSSSLDITNINYKY